MLPTPCVCGTAHAGDTFDLANFNQGDYFAAMREQTSDENISRVLYPNDSTDIGRELRLKQEYFLVSASIHLSLPVINAVSLASKRCPKPPRFT